MVGASRNKWRDQVVGGRGAYLPFREWNNFVWHGGFECVNLQTALMLDRQTLTIRAMSLRMMLQVRATCVIGASASDSIVASSAGRNAAAFSTDIEQQQDVEIQDMLNILRHNVEQDSLYSHSHAAMSEAEPIHVDPNRNLEYAWNSLYPSASAPFWETGFWSQIFGTGVGHFGHFDMLEMNRPAAVSCDPSEEC